MRKPDDFSAPAKIGNDGSHLAATVHRLAQTEPDRVFQQITNGLKALIDDINQISIDSDDKRLLYTLYATDKCGTRHPAHALSDGTLRFLALSVLRYDYHAQGLICLEEPENGIPPARISAMLSLLTDIAVDTSEPVDETNPLRQVIVNTHSPVFVGEVPEDALIMLENREVSHKSMIVNGVVVSAVEGTWRTRDERINKISKNRIVAYLMPLLKPEPVPRKEKPVKTLSRTKRIVDLYAEQIEMNLDYRKVAEDGAAYAED